MADALWINSSAGVPSYTAAELRQLMALGVMYDGRNLGGRQGVRPGGTQLSVSLVGSTITVQPGVGCMDPALTTAQGPYWYVNPAAATHTLTAADATNPRLDIVVAEVNDHDEDASGLREAITRYIAGTPNPAPVEPAIPAGCDRLATIAVPASPGAASVTDRRRYTAAPGGIVPVTAAADITAAVAGRYRHRLDTSMLEVDTGAAWVATGAFPRMGVTLQRTTPQTLPDAADTTSSWGTEVQDTHGLWVIGTPTVITIPANGDGIWSITYGAVVTSPATGRSFLSIAPSAGVWAGAGHPLRSFFGANEDSCTVSASIPLSAGDTFTCIAYVDMGGAATMTATLTAYRTSA